MITIIIRAELVITIIIIRASPSSSPPSSLQHDRSTITTCFSAYHNLLLWLFQTTFFHPRTEKPKNQNRHFWSTPKTFNTRVGRNAISDNFRIFRVYKFCSAFFENRMLGQVWLSSLFIFTYL